MFISEEEKKEILSKYDGNTSNELLTHLKRVYPVTTQKYEWMNTPIKFIQIGDKTKLLTGNKKLMVNKITSIEEDDWKSLDTSVIRRTIKKFLDSYLIDSK